MVPHGRSSMANVLSAAEARVLLLIMGTSRRVVSVDERNPSLAGAYRVRSVLKYSGARPLMALNTHSRILNAIRSLTGSQ